MPESFKVLIKELQALALDIRVLDENHQEIEIRELDDEDDDLDDALPAGHEPLPEDDEEFGEGAAAENEEGGADLDLDGDINLDDDFADFEVDDVLDDIKLDDDDDIE